MNKIYLIKSKKESAYKIGVSKNPNKRLKQLQTGNSSELELVTCYESEFAYKIEKTIHNMFSHLNENGEWYDLSIAEETKFNDICKNIEANIKFLINEGNIFI